MPAQRVVLITGASSGIRSDESVRACVQAAVEVDVLVNNAGYELAGALEETTIEEARAQFETDLFGVAASATRDERQSWCLDYVGGFLNRCSRATAHFDSV